MNKDDVSATLDTGNRPQAVSAPDRALGPASWEGGSRTLLSAGVRLLVVDDSDDTRELFASLLRLEGASVTTVASGEQALRALAQADFDLLLSDVAMPGMDGYALIAAVRAGTATASLPAVALSGFGRPEDVRRALDAGFDAHAVKPIDVDKLLSTVTSLVKSRSIARQ